MNRRKFFRSISFGGIGAIGFLFFSICKKREIKNFVKSVLYYLNPSVTLPKEGKIISLETGLNSRCTSDYDGDPEKFHWGMFDKIQKLSEEQIKKIITLARIPRFTDQKIEIRAERNMLTFVVDKRASGIQRDWMMVESGMQQQAVGLVCAALGVGMIFRYLGKDVTSISESDWATIKIKLDPMKPSYNGSFWTNLPPLGRNPWLKGSLPDPCREGDKPLISAFRNLKIKSKSGTKLTDESVGQLLWAARGRTPHFYKSRPWGMTIPTRAGKQHISGVYLISNNKLFKYINWENNRPTHSLSALDTIDSQLLKNLNKRFLLNHIYIVLATNKNSETALWEVGYQLLNLLVQAHSLDISYQAVLLDETLRASISDMTVKNPVAVFAI